MQQRVYQTKIRDVEELRQHLLKAWHNIEQPVTDASIDQWRARLKACAFAEDGHLEVEHTL